MLSSAGESAPTLFGLAFYILIHACCLFACLFVCLPACSLYVRLSLCLSVIGCVSSCGRIDHQPTSGNRTTIGTRHIGEACHCYTCILYNGYTHNPQTKPRNWQRFYSTLYINVYIYIYISKSPSVAALTGTSPKIPTVWCLRTTISYHIPPVNIQ